MNTSLSQSISLDNINIRSAVHEGVRYYSVVDCVRYLIDESEDARNYWKVLKFRANQLVTKCNQLKEDAKAAGDYGARIREIMEEALGKSIITKKQDLIEEDK